MNKTVTLLSTSILSFSSLFAQLESTAVSGRKGFQAPTAPSKIQTKKPQELKANDGDLLWDDDFSGSENWIVGTTGQGTFAVGQLAQMPNLMQSWLGIMSSTSASNGFAFFNGTQYFTAGGNGPIETQNTWIMSPLIDFTGVPAITLSFEQMYRAFNDDVTYVEFSYDDGASWVFSEIVNAEMAVNASTLHNTLEISIPVNNATQGRIRFRWSCDNDDDAYGGGYGWCIDDVVIKQAEANNLVLYTTYTTIGETGLEYSQLTTAQATVADNLVFDADVKNTGYATQDVTLHVVSGSYTGNSLASTIQPFSTGYPEIPTATGMTVPTALGPVSFAFNVTSNNTLTSTSDDAGTMGMQITPTIIAADDFDGTAESVSGSFTYWGGQTGNTEIGNQFQVFADASLTAIQVGIYPVDSANQATYLDREVVAVLYEYDADGNALYMDETTPHNIVASDYGQLLTFQFSNAAELIAGTVYLVTAKTYMGAEVPIAMAGLSPVGQTRGFDGTNYYYLGANDAYPGLGETPVVRMDFTNYAGIGESAIFTNASCFPNPFTTATTIQFNLQGEELVTVCVTDLTGREVMRVPATNYGVGSHTVSIDGSELNAGLYQYTITAGTTSITKRMVKK